MSAPNEANVKSLVEFIVQSLVDYPDQVEVQEFEDRDATVLELKVASSDMGRVIGKSGRVINSIRAIVQVSAAKLGQSVSLELLESDERR